MGYSVKLGKGGHGLEVYDSEGKYADDFSFDIEGQKIGNYEDFRSLYFNNLISQQGLQFTSEQLENYYQNNIDFKSQIDGVLYDEYNAALSQAVDIKNAQQTWDSPEETVKHLDEIFTKPLIQNLIDNNIVNSSSSIVSGTYTVSTFAACVQMVRYKQNRANPIDSNEYNKRYNNIPSEITDSTGESVSYFKKIIEDAKNNQIDMPLLRNIDGITSSEREVVRNSFYDENNPQKSCLSSYKRENCSYLGSVIYFSTFGMSYGWRSSMSIKGLVKMSPDLKLLECPATFSQVSSDGTRFIPEIIRFRGAVQNNKDLKEKMIKKFQDEGGLSNQDAEKMYNRLESEIYKDGGLCAMLMGYDAIYGISYHFDILNLGICDILKDEA